MFKSKNKATILGNNFHFRDWIPKYLASGVIYYFQCGLCNKFYYGESASHLNVRIGEHIGFHYLLNNKLSLKVQSFNLNNSKYMIASTQTTSTEIFAFVAVLVFKLLSRKVLFINIKHNRKC